jgi:hypothetical protein
MNTNTIPLLAEMIDSYLTLHYDLLMTDSISKTEELQLQLSNIEKEIKDAGCKIIYSTEKWEKYLITLPELKQYDLIFPQMLKEAKEAIDGPSAAIVLDVLRQLEESAMKKIGKKECEGKFYSEVDIIEIADGNTLVKNARFNEPKLNPLFKNL